MNFYTIDYISLAEEFAYPDEKEIIVYERACRMSEFQYIDRSLAAVKMSVDSGTEFPDFINMRNVPVISQKMKTAFDKAGVDNLFYKPVDLSIPVLGMTERHYIAIPPRIRCLDMQKTKTDSVGYARHPVIIPERTGNYQIFKLAASKEVITNNEIIIKEELKIKLEEAQLLGLIINKLEEEF